MNYKINKKIWLDKTLSRAIIAPLPYSTQVSQCYQHDSQLVQWFLLLEMLLANVEL